MLNEAMASMCVLLELAAQVIEDAEVDTTKAERDFGSGSGSSIDGRLLSWLILLVLVRR